MDLSSLTTFLKVNGLTLQNSAEEISALLRKASYSEAEITQALSIVRGDPTAEPVATAALVATAIPNTLANFQTIHTTPVSKSSILNGRIGVGQYWYAAILLSFILVAISMFLLVVVAPIFSVFVGLSIITIASSHTVTGLLPVFLILAAAMALVPAIWLGIYLIGLQVRRYHDYGLTGWMWLVVVIVAGIVRVALKNNPLLVSIGSLVTLVATITLLSWRGHKTDNAYGPPTQYASVWGSILGSTQETGNLKRFLLRVILPILAFEALAALIAVGIYFGFSHTPVQTLNSVFGTTTAQTRPLSAGVQPRTPIIIPPSGWVKTFDKVSSVYGLISYVSPDQYQRNPIGKIEITLKPSLNGIAVLGDTTTDKNKAGTQNFTQQFVFVSNITATEDEYDDVFTYGSTTIVTHYENLYFEADGYSYKVSAQYQKAAGDAYLIPIHTALSSVTLPK